MCVFGLSVIRKRSVLQLLFQTLSLCVFLSTVPPAKKNVSSCGRVLTEPPVAFCLDSLSSGQSV